MRLTLTKALTTSKKTTTEARIVKDARVCSSETQGCSALARRECAVDQVGIRIIIANPTHSTLERIFLDLVLKIMIMI